MKHLAIKVTNKYELKALQQALFDMKFTWTSCGRELCCFDDESYYLKAKIHHSFVDMIVAMKIAYSGEETDDCLCISSSEFFEKYAGHIELFPDYEEPQEIKPQDVNNALLNLKILTHLESICKAVDNLQEKVKYLLDNQ